MSFPSNELNLNGGSSTHLNGSYGVAGSSAAMPNFGNRSALKEINTNENNKMVRR